MAKQEDEPLVPLAQAIEATRLDSHTYAVNLRASFNIGTVPNGGYSCAALLQAAHLHLRDRIQPDTIAARFEFLNRTEVGPAVVVVEDVKPGRALSVLHLTLYQGRGLLPAAPWVTPGTSRKEIVAYVTNGSIAAEKGISLPTSFSTPLPGQPPVDLSFLSTRGEDNLWTRLTPASGPYGRVPSVQNFEFYQPKTGQTAPGRIDLWMRLAVPGTKFTNAALPFVVDAYPYMVEQYRPRPPGREPFAHDRVHWYPTVAMSLEVKKALPAGGVEWLFFRMESKMIRNGRFDVEVIVLDAAGELVAVATQVAMILDFTRNVSTRSSLASSSSGKKGRL